MERECAGKRPEVRPDRRVDPRVEVLQGVSGEVRARDQGRPPERHPRHAGGAVRRGGGHAGSHRDDGHARVRPDAGSARRHRRAGLVGAHRARPRAGRDRHARQAGGTEGHGLYRAALGAPVQAAADAAGHVGRAEVARGRPQPRLVHLPDASDRRRHPGVVRAAGGGDVLRVLRHPEAGRSGVHQLVRRRRGLPLRLHMDARLRQDLLLPARPRDAAQLLRPRSAEDPEERRPLGRPGDAHAEVSAEAKYQASK